MLIHEFAKFLKFRIKEPKHTQTKRKEKKQKITFAIWPLGVKGKLSREEIYDYL
jgi:hypothetical protein